MKSHFIRYAAASLALAVLALAWNGVVHLVLLRDLDARVRHLFRSDLEARLLQSILLTVAITSLFVAGYARFARSGSAGEGAAFGFFFGLVAGVLVDFNQYVMYPIPGEIALLWFCSGLLEFTLYGLIASRLVPRRRSDDAS